MVKIFRKATNMWKITDLQLQKSFLRDTNGKFIFYIISRRSYIRYR